MPKIDPIIFRGYDIRGIADENIDEEKFELLGKGYASFLAKRRVHHAVVGRDNRLSSEAYTKAFIKGLLESGVNVIDIGLALTQIVYWAQYHFKTNGGAMITASHNPSEWNGLKLACGYSTTLVGEEVQDVRKIIESEDFVTGEGTYSKKEWKNAYYKDLLKRVSVEKKFKIVIDASCGAAGVFVPELLRKTGCDVIEQNTSPDGSFPVGTPDPTEKHVLERIAKKVLEKGADLGIAYDADGDRFGVVDDRGNTIWNDVLIALFARDVLKFMPGAKIVYNVLCSKLVDDIIHEDGGEPIRWMTGHGFIRQKLSLERSPFGGELSGHIFFPDNFYGHEDGAYVALRLLEFLQHDGRKLSEVLAELPKYISSPEIKLECVDERKWDMMDKIKKDMIEKFPDAEHTTIDGIRIDFPDSMFVVRASQNGGYITIKYEAKEKDRYEELRSMIREELEKHEDINWEKGVNVESL